MTKWAIEVSDIFVIALKAQNSSLDLFLGWNRCRFYTQQLIQVLYLRGIKLSTRMFCYSMAKIWSVQNKICSKQHWTVNHFINVVTILPLSLVLFGLKSRIRLLLWPEVGIVSALPTGMVVSKVKLRKFLLHHKIYFS